MRAPEIAGKAKGVYEFDAADVPGSYIYPAMARSFRHGGAQFAAQFQYDPHVLARFNRGWQTHYLNLIYAPQKTLSFMIAAEAFHALPRGAAWGLYPTNNEFGMQLSDGRRQFRVSFDEDRSECLSETVFLHSNHTRSAPPVPAALQRLAGCGSSPIVSYDGTGAWFLDRTGPGQWRLEVYPDAVWVNDPFGRDSLEREVSRIYWKRRTMILRLPDLGPDFSIRAAEALTVQLARDGQFTVSPGVHLLARKGLETDWPSDLAAGFFAPPEQHDAPPAVWHEPVAEWVSGQPLTIRANVATADEPAVTLAFQSDAGGRWRSQRLVRDAAYAYSTTLPTEDVVGGSVRYRIVIESQGRSTSFPGALPEAEAVRVLSSEGSATQLVRPTWNVTVHPCDGPVQIFSGEKTVSLQGDAHATQAKVHGKEQMALRIAAPAGFGKPPSCTSARIELEEKRRVWSSVLAHRRALRLRARAGEASTTKVEVVLVEEDGAAWGCVVPLTPEWQDARIPWETLRFFSHWTVPPNRGQKGDRFHPEHLAAVNFCFGAWLFPEQAGEPHAIEVEGAWLEP